MLAKASSHRGRWKARSNLSQLRWMKPYEKWLTNFQAKLVHGVSLVHPRHSCQAMGISRYSVVPWSLGSVVQLHPKYVLFFGLGSALKIVNSLERERGSKPAEKQGRKETRKEGRNKERSDTMKTNKNQEIHKEVQKGHQEGSATNQGFLLWGSPGVMP